MKHPILFQIALSAFWGFGTEVLATERCESAQYVCSSDFSPGFVIDDNDETVEARRLLAGKYTLQFKAFLQPRAGAKVGVIIDNAESAHLSFVRKSDGAKIETKEVVINLEREHPMGRLNSFYGVLTNAGVRVGLSTINRPWDSPRATAAILSEYFELNPNSFGEQSMEGIACKVTCLDKAS